MKSILQNKTDYCYLCELLDGITVKRSDLECHHVIYGRANRKLSDKYGLTIYLCHRHHTEGKQAVHNNSTIRHITEEIAQRRFTQVYPDKDFMSIFGKNYIGVDR